MKPLLVFARIIIVGCLWSIIFIEGIRVIMLCNWHFDIFWPDHWRQAIALWKAGWVIRAPKEWAFVLIILSFFPMLITGWWTLSLVAWETVIYDILISPITLYRHFIKAPLNVITTNNKYGVVKRKSYKQIRPTGIGGMRSPISDYGDSTRTSAPAMLGMSNLRSSSISAMNVAPAAARVANKIKKTDTPATLDHALFKFDDDDDDFDLDFDSFEKSDMLKNKEKPKTETKKPVFSDDDDDIDYKKESSNNKNSKKSFSFDDVDDDLDLEGFDDSETKPIKNNNKNSRDSRQNKENNRNNKETNRNNNENKNSRNERKNKTSQNTDKENSNFIENKKDNNNESNNSTDNNNRSPIFETLKQKGFQVIAGISVSGTQIDFVGVSDKQLCLCLVDKEAGDWLADEELFNGEEPLWFSENSHRISPVRKLSVAKDVISKKLEEEGFELELKSFVVIQMANIINADDMFDIWNELGIDVTRINRGGPKEIRLLSKTLEDTEGSLPKADFDKLRKLLKSIK